MDDMRDLKCLLSTYLRLSHVRTTCEFFLRRRLNQHAMEWNDFIDAQGVKSILRSWKKGVNNG